MVTVESNQPYPGSGGASKAKAVNFLRVCRGGEQIAIRGGGGGT